MTQPPGNLPATSREPPGKTSRPTNYCAFYPGKTINGTLFVPLIRPPGTSRQPPGPQIPLIRTTNSDILRHKLFDILLNACRRQQLLTHFQAATSKEPPGRDHRGLILEEWRNPPENTRGTSRQPIHISPDSRSLIQKALGTLSSNVAISSHRKS